MEKTNKSLDTYAFYVHSFTATKQTIVHFRIFVFKSKISFSYRNDSIKGINIYSIDWNILSLSVLEVIGDSFVAGTLSE